MATKKNLIIFFSVLIVLGLCLVLISILVEEQHIDIHSAIIEKTEVRLENRNDRACIIISGGIADITVKGYSNEKAKPVIEQKIKELFYFDLQENDSWRYPLGTNFHTVNLFENNKFEIVADITDARSDNALMIHFVHAYEDGSFPSPGGNELDFNPNIDRFEYSVQINNINYKAIYDKENVWGLIYIQIT